MIIITTLKRQSRAPLQKQPAAELRGAVVADVSFPGLAIPKGGALLQGTGL